MSAAGCPVGAGFGVQSPALNHACGPESPAINKLPRITLVLGGARSGKSAHAEGLALSSGLAPVYIATCAPFDAELEARVAQHRARRGTQWRNLEAPLELAAAIDAQANAESVLLVDCLTLWLGNLLHHERSIEACVDALSNSLRATRGPVILVSNETSLGIVPDNALTRRFRDAAGATNQCVAALADRVVMVMAGLPLTLKPAPGAR